MIIDKYCLQCGERLPENDPKNKVYCTDACKQSAYRNRLEVHDHQPEQATSEDEGGLHPLVWLGMIGAGTWLLTKVGEPSNKVVTTRLGLPISSASTKL